MDEKKFYQSKTFYFGLISLLVGVAGLFGFADFQPDADWDQIAVILNGLVVILLRFLSDKGITF